jgi:hypothetical protein
MLARRFGMHDAPSLAYSLSQREDGWVWRVYDEEGVDVAGGADDSRAAAEAAVQRAILRRASPWEPRAFV